MNQGYKEKFDKLREQYTDEQDREIIERWENTVKSSDDWIKFSNNSVTQNIVTFLRNRIVDLRKIKAMTKGLTKEELAVYDSKIDEDMAIFRVISRDIEKELETIEQEVDQALIP